MIKALSQDLISQAKEIYERLKPTVEKRNRGEYIVIDPISKEYFIAPRLADAMRTAKDRYPDRQFFSEKIGSQSAISFSYSHIHITA